MLVVALNGFGGTVKKTAAITDLVPRALGRLGLRKEVSLVTGRGGSGVWNFRKIYKKVEATEEKTLVFIGKSYGGHWCIRLLWKLWDTERAFDFKAMGLLTVDPSFVLHRMQRKVRVIPPVQYAVNLHQFGRRSGYRLGEPAHNIPIPGEHNPLESSPRVRAEIDKILAWGCAIDAQ